MLELVPISLKEANAYVERYHRHHKPVVGHKFSIAAAVDGEIVGGSDCRQTSFEILRRRLDAGSK